MSYGFFSTIGGEVAFIITLLVGYGLGKLIEMIISTAKQSGK